MIRFIEELKDQYTSIEFHILENAHSEYQNRFRSRILQPEIVPESNFGWAGLVFLLRCLQRSRLTLSEFVDNVNRNNVFGAYLLARSHLETTGSIAYYLDSLAKYYGGTIDLPTFEMRLRRLSLGNMLEITRTFPEKVNENDLPTPIRIFKQIKKVDSEMNKLMPSKSPDHFAECYKFLSEFCHPNLFGTTVGTEIAPNKDIVFQTEIRLSERDLTILIGDLILSCSSFFRIYDLCLDFLTENEEMPEMEK